MSAAGYPPWLGWLAWGALVLLLVLLYFTARGFSRRTYRCTVLALVIAGVAAMTAYGSTRVNDFVDAFYKGTSTVIKAMVSPLVPVDGHTMPVAVAWIVLGAACAAVLVLFDTLSIHREQPCVEVRDAPKVDGGDDGDHRVADRRVLTEELQFRLPAVYVRGPATMPGGSKLDTLAAVAEKSGISYGQLTGAVMQLIHALEAQPRTYEMRCYVERCTAGGRPAKDGRTWHVTVDIQDARTGENVTSHMLPPCDRDEAAEQAAGFAARQVFLNDHATPAWAVGSRDGQDLAAYLLSRERCTRGRTFTSLQRSRRERRAILEKAVLDNPASGVIGYELAAMCDLDGDDMKSLLLHLRNRACYPRFWAARYRLAISLGALAWRIHTAKGVTRVRKDIQRQFAREQSSCQHELARLLGAVSLLPSKAVFPRTSKKATEILREDRLRAALLDNTAPSGDTLKEISKALLGQARLELRAYRHSAGTPALLWNAFWHRNVRAALLQALTNKWQGWHPRRQRLTATIAVRLAERRHRILTGANGLGPIARAGLLFRMWRLSADDALTAEQRWAVSHVSQDRQRSRLRKCVPWQAAYNTACLLALCDSGAVPPGNVCAAIDLLCLAFSDPACDLEHPSETIGMDPALRSLRGQPAPGESFNEFLDEMAMRDFSQKATARPISDKWFGGPSRPETPARTPAHDGGPRQRPAPRPPGGGRHLRIHLKHPAHRRTRTAASR